MPFYEERLKQAILREIGTTDQTPLSGLKIVVNAGNGAACFFNDLLRDLGANVDHSIHLTPDGTFPESSGVPNPEKKEFVEETLRACEACDADIGVMFDTDADRAGFILPRLLDENGLKSGYEPLNRNRLIAMLSVIFSRSAPGCTIVTDSTTSEGLSTFLQDTLSLNHFRFLRGYANVIGKAKELTSSGEANAEVAIETSGHCAMKENGYTDDGTYTAVKIIGLLARTAASGQCSLLDLISELEELPFDEEYRIRIKDGSLETTSFIFAEVTKVLKEKCNAATVWELDKDNLEGIRMKLASGGFFMLRQSLHDPVISMQVESVSAEEAKLVVLDPVLKIFNDHASSLDLSAFV
jgi:phosphomannomutase